jgi:hypothetical protein
VVARPQQAECGPDDPVETGLQGEVPVADQLSGRSQQGYACNLRRVGSTDLGGLGGDTQMTWYGDCAYRVVPGGSGESDGVAVVDVADPANPTLVEVLREPAWAGRGGPVLGIHEGIHASDARGILVVPVDTMLSVYDVHDCRSPRHLTDFTFERDADPTHDPAIGGSGIHSGQLSPDGTWYYATDIGNGAVAPNGPCLTIIDLADLTSPRVVQRWGTDFPCHDLDFNLDGTIAYVGFYEALAGHPSAVVGAFTPVAQPAQVLSGLRIVDVSALQQRQGDPTTAPLPLLGQLTGGGNHTETYARIAGRDYVLTAEESHCPGGNGRVIDVTDPTNPVQVGELALEINMPQGCDEALAGTTSGNLLTYMSHYVSVDDDTDATLAFVSWYSSGLRVFDISDPTEPVEVAYYNPAVGEGAGVDHDSTTTYQRYRPDTGQVWVGSGVNALSVVELAPWLRPVPPEPPTGEVSATWSVGPTSGTVVASPQGVAASRLSLDDSTVAWNCTLRFAAALQG